MLQVDMLSKKKYPRTYHFPWSETVTVDDKRIKNTSHFHGKTVICTIKKDGESTSMYTDYMHARSLDSKHNFTRDWAKKMHSVLKFDIPPNWIFSFENLAYFHSIYYDDLESFCYLLNIWKDDGYCLSQKDLDEYATILDLAQPEVIYKGIYDEDIISKLHLDSNIIDLNKEEGYVMRVTDSFHRDDFSQNVAKFVRKNHVQPTEDGEDEHWLKKTYPNKLSTTKKIKPYFMA